MAACLLDTGVARAHPLIAPSLPPEDQHAVDERWGKDDHKRNGHGTLMAGTALFGDLTYPLADQRAIALSHNLESVTLVPPDGFAPTEPHNYGFVTQGAIGLPEIAASGPRPQTLHAEVNRRGYTKRTFAHTRSATVRVSPITSVVAGTVTARPYPSL